MNAEIGIQAQAFGQYDALRRELGCLSNAFELAGQGGALGHQRISPLGETPTTKEWEAFMAENTHPQGEWQEWDVFPNRESCSRYFGSEGGVTQFQRLASIAMGLLTKISKLKYARGVILPEDFHIHLPTDQEWYGWLQLLYETAGAYSTPVLYAEPWYWGCTGQLTSEEESWKRNSDGVWFRAHPFYEELRCDLFESSAEAIRMWLDPDQADSFGDYITETPIYLPPEPEQNGPVPPNRFLLLGKPYEFSQKAWLLLCFLYGKGPVLQEDATNHIYGGGNNDDEGRFKSTVKRLQGELLKQECPAEIHTKNQYIALVTFNPN